MRTCLHSRLAPCLQRCVTGAIDERVDPETVLSILNYYQAPEALEYRSNGPFLEEGLCILVSLPGPKAVHISPPVGSATACIRPAHVLDLLDNYTMAYTWHVPAILRAIASGLGTVRSTKALPCRLLNLCL